MTPHPTSLFIQPVKHGGYMVADYSAKGTREYILRTPLIDAAPELLEACKQLRSAAAEQGCGFKFVDDLLARLAEPSND